MNQENIEGDLDIIEIMVFMIRTSEMYVLFDTLGTLGRRQWVEYRGRQFRKIILELVTTDFAQYT